MAQWHNGTSEYDRYLRSALWRKIKARIEARDKGECCICGGDAIEVHHHDYSEATMRGENDAALSSLCRDCHRAIEFDGPYRRFDLADKQKAFDQRRRDHQRALRYGLKVSIDVSAKGNWQHIRFEWEDPSLATQFSSMLALLWKLLYVFRPQVAPLRRISLTRFSQASGVRLLLKDTKKLAAVLQLSDDKLRGEVRYRPDFLPNPLPGLRVSLGNVRSITSDKAVRKRMAKITGGARNYKIILSGDATVFKDSVVAPAS